MSRIYAVLMIILLALPAAFAQTVPAARPTTSLIADQSNQPKLEHFDPNLVDKSLDPCNDFYKYSCNKWLSANPTATAGFKGLKNRNCGVPGTCGGSLSLQRCR